VLLPSALSSTIAYQISSSSFVSSTFSEKALALEVVESSYSVIGGNGEVDDDDDVNVDDDDCDDDDSLLLSKEEEDSISWTSPSVSPLFSPVGLSSDVDVEDSALVGISCREGSSSSFDASSR